MSLDLHLLPPQLQPSVEVEMLLPPESPGNKTAEHIAKSVAPLAIMPGYSEGDLVGYT